MVRVFLTGGNGITSKAVAENLNQRGNVNIIMSSRSGKVSVDFAHECVKFDWYDASSFESVFQYGKVDAVYLVSAKGSADPIKEMKPFIDLAMSKGTKRFVFCGGGTMTLDQPFGYALVWKYLLQVGAEYAIFKPTWFFDNFATETRHLDTIKKDNAIYTACNDGKTGWLSGQDIAACIAEALVAEKSLDGDFYLSGPELLDCEQIAATFSKALGREIKFVNKSSSEIVEHIKSGGVPEAGAQFLAYLEERTASGSLANLDDNVETITGKRPVSLEQWVQANKAVWL